MTDLKPSRSYLNEKQAHHQKNKENQNPLKDEQIAIETKMTNTNNLEKKIGEDLMIDIERFQKHEDCKHLICFVYDSTNILENPRELESDLSGIHGSITVEVIVYPK